MASITSTSNVTDQGTGVTTTTFSDGTKVIAQKNGTVTLHKPTARTVISDVTDPATGTTTKIFADGSKTVTQENGTVVVVKPNGETFALPEGPARRFPASGYPDPGTIPGAWNYDQSIAPGTYPGTSTNLGAVQATYGTNQTYGTNTAQTTTQDTTLPAGTVARTVTPALTIQSQTTDGTSGNVTTTYMNGLVVVTSKTGSVVGAPLTVADNTTEANGDKITTYTNGVVILTRPDGSVVIK